MTVRILAKVTPWLVRRFYKKDKIKDRLDIQPLATGEGITISRNSQYISCWLNVRNLNPFKIRLDRFSLQISTDGISREILHIIPEEIESLESKKIYSKAWFTCTEESIALAKKRKSVRIEMKIYIVSKIASFDFTHHIDQINNVEIHG